MQYLTQHQLHNPALGIPGDSLRTCLAMLTGIAPEQIPIYDWPGALENAAFMLTARGMHVRMFTDCIQAPDHPYLVQAQGIYTPGHVHWMVAQGDRILHDPHPAGRVKGLLIRNFNGAFYAITGMPQNPEP